MLGVWTTLEPAARLIVAMLFNGLWQGAAIALAVWAILRIFPNANASTRYAAWSAALLAVLVVPLLTTLPRVSAEYAASTARATVRSHLVSSKPLEHLPARAVHIVTPVAVPWTPPRFVVPAWLAVALFAIWALVALASFVRLILSLVQLERLKSDSLPLGVEYRDVMARWAGAAKGARDVRLCVSNEIEVPVAIGLFDAMILLPKHLLDRLESHEIDQISLHELAHLRRADDWTNGLQRIAQALLFFNPAVAFIAHQMDLEREVACDDWVLASTGDARPYAFCLTKMAEATVWPHRALAAPGAFVTRKNISIRIERLLAAKRAIGSALLPGPSSAVLVALIAAFFVLRTVTPSIAYTTQPAPEHTVSKNSPQPRHGASAAPAPTERPPSVIPGGPHTVVFESFSKTTAAPQHATRLPKIATLPTDISRVVAETSRLASSIVAQATTVRIATTVKLGAFNCLGCDMHGISWPGRDLHGAVMTGADFHGADLHGANFSRAQLSGIDLRNADLRGASFAGAYMLGCDLKGAQLEGADFAGASLTGCTFDPSVLSPAQALVMLRACMGCDFHGVNLRDRDLRNISLTGVDMSGADLRGADLSGAHLAGVDFKNARFDGAKLNGASFTGCDFSRVDLRAVDLSHANLTGSSFSDAIMR